MTEKQYDAFFAAGIDSSILEIDESPYTQDPQGNGPGGLCQIEIPEFTSINRLTGVPDQAHIIIEYVPRAFVLQLDSVSTYLSSYRSAELTPEEVIAQITNDLAEAIQPMRIGVRSKFSQRDNVAASPQGQWIHPDLRKHTAAQVRQSRVLAPPHARAN